VLEVRLIYRNLCQMELEWDEPMPEQALRRWERWLSSLPDLCSISIPCSFHLNSYENMQKCQFRGCLNLGLRSCVLYSRRRPRKRGRVHVVHGEITFGASRRNFNCKTGIDGGSDGSGTKCSVKKELNIDLRLSVFWTDSKVVLQSI